LLTSSLTSEAFLESLFLILSFYSKLKSFCYAVLSIFCENSSLYIHSRIFNIIPTWIPITRAVSCHVLSLVLSCVHSWRLISVTAKRQPCSQHFSLHGPMATQCEQRRPSSDTSCFVYGQSSDFIIQGITYSKYLF
jgi:hypothetical protein